MSYLDVPRLHFAGTFSANPSTVNNTHANFNPKVTHPVPAWNPMGNHAWQFLNCRVQSAVGASGQISADPIIGADVLSPDQPVIAKLVDLDTDQQGVSEIWGFQVKVAVSATDYFMGNFRVVCFNDLWGRVLNGHPDSMFSAYYQSFLDDVSWGSQISSPFLQELQSVSPARLSIKFVVDGYQDDSSSPQFNQGRIVGTIGPAWADEPSNFVAGRALRPPAQNAALNFGYARVDQLRQRVMVDLGNSVPTTSPAGPPPNLGTLQLAIIPSSGSTIILGAYDYTQATYQASAGIQEYPLSTAQLALLENTPLGVVQTNAPGGSNNPAVVLREGQNGTYICASQQVYRMNPGDVDTVELIALQFGKAAAGQQLNLQLGNLNDTPASALTFPQSVTTGPDGRASFPLTAANPGNPRDYIDGQVYGVTYDWTLDDDPDFPPDSGNNFVSVLVFDSFEEAPTWENIQPIMQQYAKLYPFMDSIFQLDDPTVIQQNIAAFQQVLNIPIADPRYMPVTRDMSRDKRQRILEWLNLGAPTAKSPTAKY